MDRHRKTHTDKSTWEFRCNWAGCTFVCTQKGGFTAHVRSKHTREMLPPCGMPAYSEDGEALGPCEYACPDASSMTRHRQRVHGVPRPRAGRTEEPEEMKEVVEEPQAPPPTMWGVDGVKTTPSPPHIMSVYWPLPDPARYRDPNEGGMDMSEDDGPDCDDDDEEEEEEEEEEENHPDQQINGNIVIHPLTCAFDWHR
ncbi:hypothetical protein PHLCEN_2v11343 [Hermanssonia centrifuga]|uniref:C2H2-type domain-containing protein n=1 Tax=Hermanssonia centrifuga TaxID=98765 RepID=A0A2R6NK87_9APHY|nr:hypothetical protein PHLCEN_2v11343 [Hermanssonia centrifuga]